LLAIFVLVTFVALDLSMTIRKNIVLYYCAQNSISHVTLLLGQYMLSSLFWVAKHLNVKKIEVIMNWLVL